MRVLVLAILDFTIRERIFVLPAVLSASRVQAPQQLVQVVIAIILEPDRVQGPALVCQVTLMLELECVRSVVINAKPALGQPETVPLVIPV